MAHDKTPSGCEKLSKKSKDGFGRAWIMENAPDIIGDYDKMTIRQLFYQLVAIGFPNSQRHYKRLVSAMEKARWEGVVDFDDFEDREREMTRYCDDDDIDYDEAFNDAKKGLRIRMKSYSIDRWANQPYSVEVWVEKKALLGVFDHTCSTLRVGLFACKGYPSLTALYEASERFSWTDKDTVILYFGDHDPSGDDIPRSIEENLSRMGCNVEIIRCALSKEQVIEFGLPPAPTKRSDSRSKNWDGLGQVELDAVKPDILQQMICDNVADYFDDELNEARLTRLSKESKQFKEAMIDYVSSGQFETDLENVKDF